MTDTNPTRSPAAAEYTTAGANAIRLLNKAASWFKSQGYLVRAEVVWPEEDPRFVFRWSPNEPPGEGFQFRRLGDEAFAANVRVHWIPVVGAVGNPSHPSIEDLTPILATLRMLPELRLEAQAARDNALRALRDGAGDMEEWLAEVAPPVKDEAKP